jgi:hypothetical protein
MFEEIAILKEFYSEPRIITDPLTWAMMRIVSTKYPGMFEFYGSLEINMGQTPIEWNITNPEEVIGGIILIKSSLKIQENAVI